MVDLNQSRCCGAAQCAGLILLSLCMICLLSANSLAIENDGQIVISDVIVKRSNIFAAGNSDSVDPQQRVAAGVNRFHKTTRESAVLREAGVGPGDTIAVADVAEIERRLRELGIFASVAVSLVTGANGVELHITTQDNFSIVAGVTGSFLGGVGNLGFTVGERNLFGSGNTLQFGLSRSTTDSFRGSVAFTDLHFFEKPWQVKYAAGRTNEGDFFGVELSDSFRAIGSGREWSVTADYIERFRKYYLNGDVVFQLPEDRSRFIAKHIWRSGEADLLFRRGLELSLQQSVYSAPSGTYNEISQPEDSRVLYLGGLLARDRVSSYKKVLGLDTLRFVQDIRMGSIAAIKLGAKLIEEFNTTEESRVDPEVTLKLDNVISVGDNSLIRTSLTGTAILEESGGRPWNATASLKLYNTSINNTTIAFNTDYTNGEDGSELPMQLTLGENNGLRGYGLRQFQGRQRLRINLEGRYNPGWKLGFLDVGAIGFVDAGWAVAIDEPSSPLKKSVGAGLRLASNSLLGSRIFRIDLAFPLDAPAGETSDPSLSASVGQVFTF